MRWSRPKWQQDLANYFLDNIFDFLTIAASVYVVWTLAILKNG